jgi:hypothetical protein
VIKIQTASDWDLTADKKLHRDRYSAWSARMVRIYDECLNANALTNEGTVFASFSAFGLAYCNRMQRVPPHSIAYSSSIAFDNGPQCSTIQSNAMHSIGNRHFIILSCSDHCLSWDFLALLLKESQDLQ